MVRSTWIAFAGAGLVFAAGCSSASTPKAAATSSTSPAAAATSAAPNAAGPADPAAAKAAIAHNWQVFFSSATPEAVAVRYLEGASGLATALHNAAAQLKAQGGTESATVTSVTFTSPTSANVKYTLSIKGTPVLTNADGTAVLTAGTWQVSKHTFCTLVSLGAGKAVPGCS